MLEHDIEYARLKSLTINTSFFDRNRILNPIHRVALLRVALKMDLGHEWLISGTDREQMKVCAAPELRRAGRIGPVGNWTNALELVETGFRRDQTPAVA